METKVILVSTSRKTAFPLEAKVILVSTSRKTAFPLEVAALRRLIAFQHHSGIQSTRTGGANVYSTYASVAILTLHPNSSTRIEAQASSVAPVVRTQNKSNIRISYLLQYGADGSESKPCLGDCTSWII